MAGNDENRGKCYTFIWKLENVRYCWHKIGNGIKSPAFRLDEIEKSIWSLAFYPRIGKDETVVGLYLLRLTDNIVVNVKIDSEIAFLAFNGAVLFSDSCRNTTFDQENRKFWCRAKRSDVFSERRSSFNFRDTFTVRCKIWKSESEILKDVQCIARTHISVQKTSFLWQIKNFSTLELEKNYDYPIQSLEDNRKLMSLNLSIKRDQKIGIFVSSEDPEIKFYTFDLSAIDSNGNTIEGLKDESWSNEPDQIKQISFSLLKTKLTEKKSIYLPNDILSLKCKCVMSFGKSWQEIEGISYDCTAFEKDEMRIVSDEEHIVSVSKDVLNESFKSLLSVENESTLFKHMIDNLQKSIDNGSLSDIKLRTSSKTLYLANMFILSARSPVFKEMFSGESNHRMNDYVDIKNLEDETLSRILQYIYRSEVEQLDWKSAIKLYVGADAYKILDLKKKCSDYLRKNMSWKKACEVLELAHLHKDRDLEICTQNYILKCPRSVTSSEEWQKLKETNPMLALETLELKYKTTPKKSKGKQEKPPGRQKKRKLEDSIDSKAQITNYFKESKNIQADAVPSCSPMPQLPVDLPQEPGNRKELEAVSIQSSPSFSIDSDEAVSIQSSPSFSINSDEASDE